MKLHHICIQTNDYEASLAFYRDALGMKVLEETRGFHGRAYNTWLGGPDLMIELQTPKAGETFAPAGDKTQGLAHFCFYVEDIEAAYRMLAARGVPFRLKAGKALYDVNGGRLFKVVAPEGAILEFREEPGYK